MKSLNTYKNINKNSINAFNPSYISKLMNFRKNNGNPSKINKDIPLFFYNNKTSVLLKPPKINLNNRKILENFDSTNDIGLKNSNNNCVFKTSLSSSSTSSNYYTKRRSQLYKNPNAKGTEQNIAQSRNINKINGNSLSKTTWSSFSYKEANSNQNNKNTNGYDIKIPMNKKSSRIKNLKDRNNNNNNAYKADNYNEFNLDKLRENGIEFCIDKDGNPMTISEIKTNNKYPIAFIVQKNDKNILLDLDYRIINPNNKGDYILPQKPYFIIRRYDVQYPELRVNNNENENKNIEYNKIGSNSDYISINVNDSNEKIRNDEKKNISKNKNFKLYSFTNFGEESNNFFTKIENHKNIQNKTSLTNPKNTMTISNDSINTKNNISNLREKRKYIFVNKLANENKSMQLKTNIDNENDIDNENNNYFCTQLNSLNNSCKNKDIDNKYLYNNNNNINNNTYNNNNTTTNNNNVSKKEEPKYLSEKRNNFKLFIKNLNGFKNKTNKLKKIKCFTHKQIKNLEFKFERKYKNRNVTTFVRPSFVPSDFKLDNNNETPKGQSTIREEAKINKTEKMENFNIRNRKKQRCSYSLNELMYNNSIERQNNFSTPNNMLTNLSTLNHSFLSPPSDATAYTTIQNLHRELEKNKRFIVNQTQGGNGVNVNVKKFNSFKYYLKPRINSQKVFHKRKKTEDMNRIEKKKFGLFKSINENDNNTINTNSMKKFYSTALDFSIKNCQHNISNIYNHNTENIENININNSVCKCPFCHHLFYN